MINFVFYLGMFLTVLSGVSIIGSFFFAALLSISEHLAKEAQSVKIHLIQMVMFASGVTMIFIGK